jgi:hypothetical protein
LVAVFATLTLECAEFVAVVGFVEVLMIVTLLCVGCCEAVCVGDVTVDETVCVVVD